MEMAGTVLERTTNTVQGKLSRAAIVTALLLLPILVGGCEAKRSIDIDVAVSFPTSAQLHPKRHALLVAGFDGEVEEVDLSGRVPPVTLIKAGQDGRQQALRIRVDQQRDRLWVLDSDALYLYRLTSSELVHRINLPYFYYSRFNCFPDMVIGRSGSVLISSSVQPKLWLVDSQSLAVDAFDVEVDKDGDKDFGFSALVFANNGATLYAASATIGALWRIDVARQRASKITLSKPIRGACSLMTSRRNDEPVGAIGLVLYVAGGFRGGIKRVDVFQGDKLGRVFDLAVPGHLKDPVELLKFNTLILAVSSQLSQHPSLNESGKPELPFKINVLYAPLH